MKRSGPPARRTPLPRGRWRRGDNPESYTQRGGSQTGPPAGRRPPTTRPRKPLNAVRPKRIANRPVEDDARVEVWGRDAGACQFPHDHSAMVDVECSAPWPDWPPVVDGDPTVYRPGRPPGWRPDPRNRGNLQLCHVKPRDLCTAEEKWSTHNLFVGCCAANAWAEEQTGLAFETGRHAHSWDHVFEGKVVA